MKTCCNSMSQQRAKPWQALDTKARAPLSYPVVVIRLAWSRQLLEGESSKEIPTSAVPLWLPPDPSSKQDVMRVLRRLFVSSDDIANRGDDQQGRRSSPLSKSDSGATSNGTLEGKEPRSNGVPRISGAPHGYSMPPAAARVAFPALITRYCGENKGRSDGGEQGSGTGWLDGDDSVCSALEMDVHALAMLVFVEWREFISAIPGCGAVLSRETSALWFAQVTSDEATRVLVPS